MAQRLFTKSFAGKTRNRQRGYSLVEALIVVSIGLILTGFAVPMVQSALRSYTVSSSAYNVSRIIGLARYAGITQGRNSCTLFTGNQFGVDSDCDGALAATDTRVQIPVGVTVDLAPPGGVPTNGIAFTCTTFALTFNTRGSKTKVCGIDTGGAVTNAFYLWGWNNTTAVTITGPGRARSWRYINGTWQ